MALMKLCRNCKKPIAYGLSYCASCAPIGERLREGGVSASNKKYNESRNPKYKRFYNGIQWRTLSKSKLSKDPVCQLCKCKIAVEVDHIKEIQSDTGWDLRYDWSNLQSVCLKCHNKKHNRFSK